MQLTTVGKEVFRGARKALELAEAGAGDPTVQQRLRQLKQVEALRKREAPWSEVQEVVGLSRASYYRWKGRLKEQGLTGLKPRSKRPQRLRGKVHWSPELLAQVEGLRKENPTWGRWPIWLSLRKAGYTLSERRVGRILAYLEGQGRIERVASFLARARRGKSQRRAPRPYAQRRPPGYEVKAPGDLVQIDTLSVSLGPGEEVKHFCAVELSTRLAWAAVRWRATAQTAAGFLRELVDRSPFPIRAVQVDGGSEFMAAFEEGCQALGIRLFGVLSSTAMWNVYSGPSGTSSTPGPCPRPSVKSRPSWRTTWRTTTAIDPTWPWRAWLPWSSWLNYRRSWFPKSLRCVDRLQSLAATRATVFIYVGRTPASN
jgi:transposase